MDNTKMKHPEKTREQFFYEAEEIEIGTLGDDSDIAFVSDSEFWKIEMDKVAEAFEVKEGCHMKEEEQALVLYQNGNNVTAGFVGKREGKFICLTDTVQIDFMEESQKADRRLLEKMKEIVDFEKINAIGISEKDEKNKKAFEEFYDSVERIKQEFLRKNEVTVVFKNIWFETSEVLTRKEYEECMLPIYQFFSRKVQEIQEKYLIDGFSKIYLIGDKNSDVMLWKYLRDVSNRSQCQVFFAENFICQK